MSRDDFDWGDNADVVLRAYGSIAVHENPNGDVVVRQERDALEDEDRFVAIPVQDAELIAQAIIEKAARSRRAGLATIAGRHLHKSSPSPSSRRGLPCLRRRRLDRP
jgi:hypothetical protein